MIWFWAIVFLFEKEYLAGTMGGLERRTSGFSLHKGDWSLHRKGPIDAARHDEKVKEAIKDNLGNIIADESIITSDGRKIVKVPIKGLELPRFRYGDNGESERVGQGSGDSKVGDVIGTVPRPEDAGKGKNAGDQPGIDYYEAEITVEELADLLFADLGLPNLKPKQAEQIPSESPVWDDSRRSGPMSNLDKKRTARAAILRDARNHPERKPKLVGIKQEDLRFKVWRQDIKPDSNAVVVAMRDVSGSMGEFEKYITRSFYFWMVRFLRHKYDNVQIAFITHHTEAKEVDEETFFKLGESGGTKASSAYTKALEIIGERFDPERWNIYPIHFSDGDNWGDADNSRCIELVHKLVDVSSCFGYGEIQEGGYHSLSTLMSAYAYSGINDERFIRMVITDKKDIYPALRKFFPKDLPEKAA